MDLLRVVNMYLQSFLQYCWEYASAKSKSLTGIFCLNILATNSKVYCKTSADVLDEKKVDSNFYFCQTNVSLLLSHTFCLSCSTAILIWRKSSHVAEQVPAFIKLSHFSKR